MTTGRINQVLHGYQRYHIVELQLERIAHDYDFSAWQRSLLNELLAFLIVIN